MDSPNAMLYGVKSRARQSKQSDIQSTTSARTPLLWSIPPIGATKTMEMVHSAATAVNAPKRTSMLRGYAVSKIQAVGFATVVTSWKRESEKPAKVVIEFVAFRVHGLDDHAAACCRCCAACCGERQLACHARGLVVNLRVGV